MLKKIVASVSFFMILIAVGFIATKSNPPVSEPAVKYFELVVGNDGLPTREIREVWYKSNPYRDLGFAHHVPHSGNSYRGIYSQCEGLGIIRDGKILLFQKDSFCYIVQVPATELNSDLGINLNRQRPVLELSVQKSLPRIILVDASLSSDVQGIVLAEYLDENFYSHLPEIVEDFKFISTELTGTYWRGLTLDMYVNEHYPRLAESGISFLDDVDLVMVGAAYGSVFGENPKTESDAYHRGRFIEMYSVYLACSRMKACEYSEYFDEFKQNNS